MCEDFLVQAHTKATVANWADDVRNNGRPEPYFCHVVEITPDGATTIAGATQGPCGEIAGIGPAW